MTATTPGAAGVRRVVLAIPVSGVAFWDRLVREWEAAGWETKVWSGCTEVAYRQRNGVWGNVWLRLRLNVWFPLGVLLCGFLQPKETVFLIPTTPFFLPGAAGTLWSLRGLRVVHLLYDLYPDLLVLAGKVRRGSLLCRVLEAVTRLNVRRCAATVFLGERLRSYAERKYGRPRLGRIIPVGADGTVFRDAIPRQRCNGPITVLYAGNMGYMHDVMTLEKLLSDGIPPGLRLVFHASGYGYDLLRRRVSDKEPRWSTQIKWGGPLNFESWARALLAAEVGLVTMAPGAEDVLFPSKAYSAMMAGQALLAVCPLASDLAETIRQYDCGWVVEPGDCEGLRAAMWEIVQKPDLLLQRRHNAFDAGHKCFDMGHVAAEWAALLQELTS